MVRPTSLREVQAVRRRPGREASSRGKAACRVVGGVVPHSVDWAITRKGAYMACPPRASLPAAQATARSSPKRGGCKSALGSSCFVRVWLRTRRRSLLFRNQHLPVPRAPPVGFWFSSVISTLSRAVPGPLPQRASKSPTGPAKWPVECARLANPAPSSCQALSLARAAPAGHFVCGAGLSSSSVMIL